MVDVPVVALGLEAVVEVGVVLVVPGLELVVEDDGVLLVAAAAWLVIKLRDF